MKRPMTHGTEGVLPMAAGAGGELAKTVPGLWEFLADEKYDDGTPRPTGTIMFLTEEGLLKCWLHDRDGQGRSVWVSAPTWEKLLKAAERAVVGDATPWRRDRPPNERGKRK